MRSRPFLSTVTTLPCRRIKQLHLAAAYIAKEYALLVIYFVPSILEIATPQDVTAVLHFLYNRIFCARPFANVGISTLFLYRRSFLLFSSES